MRDKLQERLCYRALRKTPQDRVQKKKKNCLSPIITKSDQHPVSPNKINVQSIEKVTKTIKLINKGRFL